MKTRLKLSLLLFICSCKMKNVDECGNVVPYSSREEIVAVLNKTNLESFDYLRLLVSTLLLDSCVQRNDTAVIDLLKSSRFIRVELPRDIYFCFDSLAISKFKVDSLLLQSMVKCNKPSYNNMFRTSSFMTIEPSNLGTEVLSILFQIRGAELGNYSTHVIKNNDTFIGIYNGTKRIEDYFSN